MLLDTHVVLWVLEDNRRLGARTRAAMLATERVQFSAASVWELVIKEMLGKVSIPPELITDLAEAGLTELRVSAGHAAAVRRFARLATHDPFDRLLVAQAWSEGTVLVTADRALLGADLDHVVDARL